MHHLDVAAAYAVGGLRGKSRFLAGGLDQHEAPRGIDDGQRQAGKSRAGADVRDTRAAQIRMQAQAVEHVFAQHAGPIANRRQIEFAVGALELVDEAQQGVYLRLLQGQPDFARARREQFALGLERHGLKAALRRVTTTGSSGSPESSASRTLKLMSPSCP